MLKQYLFIFLLLINSLFAGGNYILLGFNEKEKEHDIYLGCLSCPKDHKDSVQNKNGTYGSKYSSKSIFSKYGEYGKKYSKLSPCFKYATNPPIVADEDGNFYGFFSVNKNQEKLITDQRTLNWLKNEVCRK